jgi:hypothetical protein
MAQRLGALSIFFKTSDELYGFWRSFADSVTKEISVVGDQVFAVIRFKNYDLSDHQFIGLNVESLDKRTLYALIPRRLSSLSTKAKTLLHPCRVSRVPRNPTQGNKKSDVRVTDRSGCVFGKIDPQGVTFWQACDT